MAEEVLTSLNVQVSVRVYAGTEKAMGGMGREKRLAKSGTLKMLSMNGKVRLYDVSVKCWGVGAGWIWVPSKNVELVEQGLGMACFTRQIRDRGATVIGAYGDGFSMVFMYYYGLPQPAQLLFPQNRRRQNTPLRND